MASSPQVLRRAIAVALMLAVALAWYASPFDTSAETNPLPAQPTGLSTLAGDTQVKLSWTDPDSLSIDKYQLWQHAQSETLTGANDEFGFSVAVVGDIAVVGMPDDNAGTGDDPGAAFVFSRSADVWTLKYNLKSNGAVDDDGFGTSVAFDGETIVVGAPFDDGKDGDGNDVTEAGAAYVFTKPAAGWAGGTNTVDLTETAKLTASDGVGGVDGDEFGNSVAVDGEIVVVGAYGHGVTKGAAYVFAKPGAGWADGNETATLTASSAAQGDYFGSSVAIDGDIILVGASGDDSSRGSAFVFTKPTTDANSDSSIDWNDWDSLTTDNKAALTATLTASDGADNDEFGYSVALDGNTVVVGAWGDAVADTDSGSAYVFTKPVSGWANATETAKLTASDGENDDAFGYSVAVDGEIVVVGAYGRGGTTGAAYVFAKPGAGWADGNETATLTASNGAAGDYFGNSVAIDANTIVVGAETANAACVFDIVAWHDIAEKGDTSHIVRRLTNDIEHTFLVRAVNANGTGPPSDSKAATPVEAAYAPARPRNFSATQTGIGEVELTWDAHRYPLTVTGYEYNQDAGGGSSWTDIDGSDSSTVSHTVTGLTKGTTYTFAVRAANSSSAGSTESDSQSVTIVGVPAAPGSFAAEAGDTQVRLGWGSPADLTISGYEYQQGGGDWKPIPRSRSGTTSHIVTGLTNGTAYTFQVRAVNAAGESGSSGEKSATPAKASSALVKPEGFAARQTGIGQVELTWEASSNPLDVTGYEFEQNSGSWTTIPNSDSSTVSHTITGLTQGVRYTFRVRAVNSAGPTESDSESDSQSVTIVAKPTAPGSFAAEAGDTQVGLTWKNPGNASITGYQLLQFPESIKLISNDRDDDDELGWSVAVDGDTLVIGALGDDPKNTGAAYVFTRDARGWPQVGKLTAANRDTEFGDDAGFGHSVAVHGDTIVVGAYEEDTEGADAGAAYVFTKPATGWANMTETARLTASDAAAGDEFGTSVAVHGDTIVVGAPEEDTGARGSAYIFTKPANGWADGTETATLRGQSNGDRFGRSVAVYGDTVVVGAAEENDRKGAAHVFTKSGATGVWDDWDGKKASTATARLTAYDRADNDRFGRAVAMDGDTIVVGALYNDYDDPDNNTNDVSDSGAAYVFIKTATGGWATDTETAKLTASDRAQNDQFGISVAVDGKTVVVGADQDDSSRGSAYVFNKPPTGWTDTEGSDKLIAYDRSQDDRFGNFVAVDGDTVLVGAVGDDSDQGSAYVFGTGEWADIPGSGAATTSHIARGLVNNVKHTFRVRAVNAAGAGAASNSATATPEAATGAPDKPEIFSAKQTGFGQVELKWSAASSPLTVTGYQYSNDDGTNWSDISGSDSGTVSHTVTGLTDKDTYTFALRAVNNSSAGQSGPSNSADVTIVAKPVPPTGLRATPGDTQATVNWNVQSNVEHQPTDKYQLLQVPQSKLTADDAAANDEFGYSVTIDGNTAVVGIPGSNNKTGAAYVFTRSADNSGWEQTAKLTASGGAADDEFGISVAVDGDTMVIGAPGTTSDTGAAYVFTKPGTDANDDGSIDWEDWASLIAVDKAALTANLTASDGLVDDKFGISVAVDGNVVMVGASAGDRTDTGGNTIIDSGAAYVFTRVSGVWGQKAKLTAADGAANDEFGISVAIDGDTVVVGAHKHEVNGDLDAGGVYVYTKQAIAWANDTGKTYRNQTAKLTPSDGEAGDEFGIAVGIYGDTVVVGAHKHDANSNSDAGAAYIFARNSNSGKWGDGEKLTASNSDAGDGFGRSVAVDGETIVIGAYMDNRSDGIVTSSGSVYVFNRDSDVWREALNLHAPDASANDWLGYSVAVVGGSLLAGAPQDDDTGSAYLIDISDAEWADLDPAELTVPDNYNYRVLNLDNDQEYAFRVRSVNVAGNSPSAETLSATPMAAEPGKTFGLSARAGDRRVTLSWDDPGDSSLTGYQLRYPTQTRLTPSSYGENNGLFGSSVAVDDGTAVVGAPQHDGTDLQGSAITNSGAAYVFVKDSSGWSTPIELTAGSDGARNDQFGYSVAVDGDTIVIGAYQPRYRVGDQYVDVGPGAAYIFTRDPVSGAWSEPVKLVASDGAVNDWFGYSVAVHEGVIVVGAREHNGKAGAAYVFTRPATGWADIGNITAAKLTASDSAGFDRFGQSVAVHGNTIVVGAHLRDGTDSGGNAITDSGSAYVFTKPGTDANDDGSIDWEDWAYLIAVDKAALTAKVTASDGKNGDQFGYSVAVDGNTVVVGAQQHDGDKGSAYVFTKPEDWDPTENTETAKLGASDGAGSDYFGSSVAVRGGTIVVGAYAANIVEADDDDGNDPRSGAAYIFTQTKPANANDWSNDVNEDHKTETAKLILPRGEGVDEEDDKFGHSVALDGQSILVGAPQSDYMDAANDDFGSVYVSNIPAWTRIPGSEATTTSHRVRGLTNSVEYTFQVRAVDDEGQGLASDIVRATPFRTPNIPPTFGNVNSITRTVDENAPLGTHVGSAVTATDPDRGTLTYSLSGTDASSFDIDDSTGQLTVLDPLDFEAKSVYQMKVWAYDNRNGRDVVDLTIQVTNLDELGTVVVSPEHPEVGSALTASLSDPDGSLSDISWQWARSSDGSSWSNIPGTNSDVYTPVADDVASYLRTEAFYTDGHGSDKSADAVLGRQTAQRAPSFEEDSITFSVDENALLGTLVGSALKAINQEGVILTYSLSGTDAASFVIDSSTGQITLGSETVIDYESGPARYTVIVSVSDGRDAYGNDDPTIDDQIEVNIVVINVEEAGTVSVSPEQPKVGAALTASLSDPDGSLSDISWQWARSSDRSDWSNTPGANSDTYTPVADDAGNYLRATAFYTDGHGSGKSAYAGFGRQTAQSVPSFKENTVTFSVDENTPPGTLVGHAITAIDPDDVILTYSLSGTDAASFVIDSSTGQITVGSETVIDYESGPARYSVVVSVSDGKDAYGNDDPTIDDQIEVNIDLKNIDESGTVSLSQEQAKVGAALTVSLSDPDGSLSDISWQWARSSDGSNWADITGASSSTYTPVDQDADKYLRITASYVDGAGFGKQARAVMSNPVGKLPVPLATSTPTPTPQPTAIPTAEPPPTVIPSPTSTPLATPSPTPAPLAMPSPTPEPMPTTPIVAPVDEGALSPWWIILVVGGAVAVASGIYMIVRNRGPRRGRRRSQRRGLR